MKPNEPPSQGQTEAELAHAHLRIVKSEDLLRGEKVVLIAHRGEIYRLCETRNGKLILGK